jgi:TetR/AcrR family transcriptional repressor of mexJK operon
MRTERPPSDAVGRSLRKHRAILVAAADLFLERGYLGTSMDEIAASAAVSKQTVYRHFDDKEHLFTELVLSTVGEVSDDVLDEVVQLTDTGDLAADLQDLAQRQLRMMMHPRLVRLRRLVIAEATRFPELGRTFYEQGPGRTIAVLTESFAQLAARGLLYLDDPAAAAADFNWLIVSAPLNQAMMLGDGAIPTRAELERHAQKGVQTFLAAYGRPARKP